MDDLSALLTTIGVLVGVLAYITKLVIRGELKKKNGGASSAPEGPTAEEWRTVVEQVEKTAAVCQEILDNIQPERVGSVLHRLEQMDKDLKEMGSAHPGASPTV